MSNQLFRTLKRKSSLESTAEEFCEIEFHRDGAPDLDLSVYEIERSNENVSRTCAEHSAHCLGSPPSLFHGVDLSGHDDIDIDSNPGASVFEFTRTRHRSLQLIDESELIAIASTIINERSGRHQATPADQIQKYICDRLEAGDYEWTELCNEKPKWGKWARKAHQHRTQENNSDTVPSNEIDNSSPG